jgi:hypothetical protein
MFKTGIQIFLENIVKSCITVIRILLLSGWKTRLGSYKSHECVILGNGPSLSSSIESNRDFMQGKELICVNFFPESPLYTALQPRIFITAAPELWRTGVSPELSERGKALFKTMVERTSWPLHFYIPKNASHYKEWRNIIAQNPNIRIFYFNNTPVEGFRFFRHCCFNRKLGMPRPHNVLIPSLMIAIQTRFRRVFLFGADHSWLPEISVDDDNRVLINQKHFYDEGKTTPQPMHKGGKGERKLHEVLMKFVYSFEGYFTIRQYAEYKHTQILNCTPGSFIDAFDRYKLKH